LQYRKLGSCGLEVSAIGLGCMGMSDDYGPAKDKDSIKVIHRAIEHGVTLFDTAEIYGEGHNEKLLGHAIRDRRERVLVATKFGIRIEDGKVSPANGRPEYVKAACEKSLKRLGIDVIDLYYQHRVDPDVPIEETIGAMADLVREGKIRHLGMSEAAPTTISRAHAAHPITAVQSELSLWTRDPEDGLLTTLRQLQIGFVAFSPLSRGMLGGMAPNPREMDTRDKRRGFPRFQDDNFEHNFALAQKVSELAHRLGYTSAQLALAWVLAQGDNVVTIPGTKSQSKLDENVLAAEINLTARNLSAIDLACPAGEVAGDRYSAAAIKTINL